MAYDDDLPHDLDDDMADLADNGDVEDGEDEPTDAGPAETASLDIDVPLVRWDPGDYAPYVTGVSADKLVSSAVAPLVAAARGYETVTESNLDDAFKRYNLGRKNTRQGRRVIEALWNAELLFMPWFTPEDISHAVRFGTAAQFTSTQLRPSRPQRDENGRERKYEFVSGHDTPIGLHPAIGASWVDDAPVVLAAEGPLKADAALSAYLLSHGTGVEEMRIEEGQDPRAQLSALLERIPASERVAVLSIAGAWNWRKNPEWRSMRLKGREVWVGMDADVSSNPMVYRAAAELFDYITEYHHGTPKMLSPVVTSTEAGEPSKIGIDDYLAEVGTWPSLVRMLSPSLPEPPRQPDADLVGHHMMSEDGSALLVCEPVCDQSSGKTIGGRWVPRVDIGGRVLSITEKREPSEAEIASGVPGAGASDDGEPAGVEVEITFTGLDGRVQSHVVTGPATLLSYPPDAWDRRSAEVPSAVLLHPSWPPSGAGRDGLGEQWLKALKTHRAEETTSRVVWDRMGWVPVAGQVPAFVVGDQVIADPGTEGDMLLGVGDADLNGASRFGFASEDTRGWDDPEYLETVRRDLYKVIDVFVRGQPWTNRGHAAAVLAAGLRPAVPIRPKSTLFLDGPPRKGKSATAGAIMGFWARTPGAWASDSLPGSAQDSPTAMELAAARAPIWVVDDLAPASSTHKAQDDQTKVANLIRNVFNHSARMRSNVSLTNRRLHLPRAQLVVTGENEISVASARERALRAYIGFGALNPSSEPTDAVDDLCAEDGAPSRLALAIVKFVRHLGQTNQGGWTRYYKNLLAERERIMGTATNLLLESGAKAGDCRRAAGIAADLVLALQTLSEMARRMGEHEIAQAVNWYGLARDLVDLAGEGHRAGTASSPGAALVEALSALLSSGKAHIVNGDNPSVPPGDDTAGFTAHRLGWQHLPDGSSRPGGPGIGYLVTHHETGQKAVLFAPHRTAFSAAAKESPDLIPSGQSANSSWESVWGEGLADDQKWSRLPSKSGSVLTTCRMLVGKQRANGVPVMLSVLFGDGEYEQADGPPDLRAVAD